MKLYKPTLDEMIRSREFEGFISDKLGNDLFISDPDRADRIWEYAENGSNGSTHAEVIEDWRDFLKIWDIPERCKAGIEKEIEECEKWHDKNGSLNEIIN